jgi:hypothetical protein
MGITRHQITSFSIVNDTDNVGQIILLAKKNPKIIFASALAMQTQESPRRQTPGGLFVCDHRSPHR